MARFTTAYRSFVSRLTEVEVLRREALRREKSDAVANSKEIKAMCRGAVVLLCSHVEAYVKELGENALEAFFLKKISREKLPNSLFYHISKDIFDDISETGDPSKIAEKMFYFMNSDAFLWSRVGEFPSQIPVDKFNRGFSNPAFKKVKSYLGRFGYSSYKGDIDHLLKGNSAPSINMLNHLVDTRNNIAHGDPLATKTPDELRTMINLTSLYCRATDDVFSRWCRSEFCSIRS